MCPSADQRGASAPASGLKQSRTNADGAKTIRFARVVEKSGTPHVHTLWVAPEKDPELKRAQSSERVMTVTRPAGSGNPVGTVGFHSEPGHAKEFLIFPKSLKQFHGARIIGIKFELLKEPQLKAGELPERPRLKRRKPPTRPISLPPRSGVEKKVVQFESPPSAAAKIEPQRPAVSRPRPREDDMTKESLLREVRAAMKLLEEGNSVAAYRRLQNAAGMPDDPKSA